MIEVELEFNLQNFPLDNEVKKFWTEKKGEGYKFFREKSEVILLSIGVGQMFDFEAYISGAFGRDILVDFKTSTFLIEDKKGMIDKQGKSKIFIKIKPIINRIEFL